MKKILLLLLIALPFACSTGSSIEQAETNDIRAHFELTDQQGEVVSLENTKDRYLLVNFWATWCRPCIAELPSLMALRDSLQQEPVEFILVTNESPEQTGTFLQDRKVNIPGYHMADAVETFELVGFPTTLLIDPKGEVLLKIEGATDWNSPANVNRIKQLMGHSKS